MIYLQTQRLTLRQFTEDDGENLLALDSDPEVMRYLHTSPFSDVEAYRQHIRTQYFPYYEKGGQLGYWIAELRPSGIFIGWFHLRPALKSIFAKDLEYHADELEFGYRLRRAYWGQGYATEGTRALIAHAFEKLGAKAVVASASVANIASWRVMEKVGMTRVGEFRVDRINDSAVKYEIRAR